MELQVVKGEPGGKPAGNATCEIHDEVFAGGLIIDDVLFFKHLGNVFHVFVDRSRVQDHGMIQRVDNLFLNQLLEISEVHDHAIFGMVDIPDGASGDCDKQTVGMTMQVAAGSIVIPEGVRNFKIKLLGYSNGAGHDDEFW